MKTVTKEISEELTYDRLYDSAENIWSVLFTTGYLTQRGKPDGRNYHLAVPNREIRGTAFGAYLSKTVSIRDTFVRKPTKENFYHGILLGILGYKSGWYVRSNREAGDGYSDIMIRVEDEDIGIVIEVKYAQSGELDEICRKALDQIREKGYESVLRKKAARRSSATA